MMVHLQMAPFALGAVMSAMRFDDIAAVAVLIDLRAVLRGELFSDARDGFRMVFNEAFLVSVREKFDLQEMMVRLRV